MALCSGFPVRFTRGRAVEGVFRADEVPEPFDAHLRIRATTPVGNPSHDLLGVPSLFTGGRGDPVGMQIRQHMSLKDLSGNPDGRVLGRFPFPVPVLTTVDEERALFVLSLLCHGKHWLSPLMSTKKSSR